VLPLSPGRLERHGFEYYRHCTLSLYAALNTRCGAMLGKTVARHTSQEFVALLAEVVANQPAGKELHIIANNLSAQKTARVHFTSPKQLREAIDEFIQSYNQDAVPFEWTKEVVHSVHLKPR